MAPHNVVIRWRGIMKRTALAILFLLAPAMAHAQPQQAANSIADPRTRCRVWNPEPQPSESISWSGACQGGYAQGYGMLQWFENGNPTERFEGEMQRGKPHGRGVYSWPDGSRYEGDFQNGYRTGRGVQVWPDGARYEGEYREGNFSGNGVYTWPDGSRYQGQFRNSNLHGQGVRTLANGDRYEGEYSEGKENGRGVYIWANGDRYEGEWRDGKAHGTGTRTNRNREVFSGQWTDGCFSDGKRWATAGASRQECGFR
jgi:hypothetical protein